MKFFLSDGPKIVPLSALASYQEGAELRLFCSASAPASAGRLSIEWRKNLPTDSLLLLGNDNHFLLQNHQLANNKRIQIQMMDDSSSMMKIAKLDSEDSGNYTCLAKNQHGFDFSTVKISVNG